MIIAIDGPAAAGKSTVARRVAGELGLALLDTGAMYRAVTLLALERGLDPLDGEACAALARTLGIDFDAQGRIVVDGRALEPRIRAADVTRSVSLVAAHPGVRAAIVPVQRLRAALGRGVVAEGRDIGSVVFPDAEHKFFLTASAAERARRRAAELGTPEALAQIQAEIEQRDLLDSTRRDSPLVRARGAIAIDTDGLDPEGVARAILEHVHGTS